MKRTASQNQGLISRAVHEALGTLVSPAICTQLIDRSLEPLGLDAIPESGAVVGEWIQGPLREVVEEIVGGDAAEILLMQLGPMAAYAAVARPNKPSPQVSAPPERGWLEPDRNDPLRDDDAEEDRETLERGDRADNLITAANKPLPGWGAFAEDGPPTGRFAAPASGAPYADPFLESGASSSPPDNDVAFTTRPQADGVDYGAASSRTNVAVLTATTDMGALEALRRYLTDTAIVTHIPDLVTLLDTLDTGLREPIVLIDCRRPTVHISSVIALGEDLPKGTAVVLWGADDPTWGELDRERFPNSRWVRCSREASTADLGSLCSMLIG